MDVHAQDNCPCCSYRLLRSKVGGSPDFCSNCGWVLPSPWVLFRLLRCARNHVQDQALREEITKIAPPESRDRIMPDATPDVLPSETECSCVGGCKFILPMGYTLEKFKAWGGGQLPPGVKCRQGLIQIKGGEDKQ